MRRGNPGLMKLVSDNSSVSGTSIAILLRNVRPKRLKNGDYRIANSQFMGNLQMNCDGFRVRPKVVVSVICELSAFQQMHIRNRKRREAALADAPILK